VWALAWAGTVYFLPPAPAALAPLGERQMIFAANGAPAAEVFLARWPGQPAAMTPTRQVFANGLALVGYQVGRLVPGQPLVATLYWQTTRPLPDDVQLFTQVLDRQQGMLAGINDWPLHGAYRPRAWKVGEIVPLSYAFAIPAGAAPGGYALITGVVGLTDQARVPTSDGASLAQVAALKIPLPPSAFQPEHRLEADFGGSIALEGYTVSPAPGGLRVQLAWRAERRPDFGYTLFVHAEDASGQLAGQVDQEPLNGQYPTSIWEAGETVVTDLTLPVKPGSYRLLAGWYRWDTGERLAATLAGAPLPDNSVPLGTASAP
jgi:hypothetical protein